MLRFLIVALSLVVVGCGGGGGSGGSNIGVGTQVPNVVGQSQAAATTSITNAGLRVGTVTMASSSTVAAGNVISQNPSAGTGVAPASSVDLIVSSGGNSPFGIDTRPPVANFTLPNQGGGGGGGFSLVNAFPNLPSFDRPLFLAPVPAPDTRLAVVEQSGRVRVFNPATATTTAIVVDVSALITTGGTEQGLIGFAFDPNWSSNHFVYVDYTRRGGGAIVIERYTWDGTNPAPANSKKTILEIPHPDDNANHNGGMLAFGPDGKLYIGTGDGGVVDDVHHNGQNTSSLLAKILRIDVHPANDATPYLVPGDNPLFGGVRSAIWAMGFRNPYRFSFDRQTGQLWVGDVGQGQFEEIDLVTKGMNGGWPRFQGKALYQSGVALASGTTHTPPVFDYPHPPGVAVIGGYVYRGSRFASLAGRYVYADFGPGTVWSINTNGQNNTPIAQNGSPTSFGEDNNGELYVVDQAGHILQFEDGGGGGSQPTLLSQTGLFTDLATLTPASGLIEYGLNVPFWSDGAVKRRWIAIPAGRNITFNPTGSWTFPNGTIIVKHFEMELTEGNPNTARRLETRLLINDAGTWMGFTYKWNAQETDADLLASGQSENITVQTPSGPVTWSYSYPSRTDCLQCHTAVANRALGLITRNINRDFDYGQVIDNQLRTLNHINYFSTDIGAATQYGAYPAIDDTNAPVATRARAYLAVNCAQCHRPSGPTPVNLDFRVDTPNGSMNAINVTPTQGGLGLSGARIIAPGVKESSVLWERMRRTDANRMPPLTTHRVDQAGIDLIGEWIDAL
jgi:uncharacterized repeat protein (TIGR03806 family)